MKRIITKDEFWHLGYFNWPGLVVSGVMIPNVMTCGWPTLAALEPLQMVIPVAKTRHSHNLIKDLGEYVLAYPSAKMVELVKKVGHTTGAQVEKIGWFKHEEAEFVDVPLLSDATLNIECKVSQSVDTGSHTLFIGLVQAIHYSGERDFLYHLGGDDYATIGVLGKTNWTTYVPAEGTN